MDKERFHNALALSLGYERIVNDKRINIIIDDKVNPDDPFIKIDILDGKVKIVYNASLQSESIWNEIVLPEQKETIKAHGLETEIKEIIGAVHQAYIKATTSPF